MEPVAEVVLDGEELPISICLTQHRLAHQLGNLFCFQKGPVVDPILICARPVIRLCSLLKVFDTLRSVEESVAGARAAMCQSSCNLTESVRKDVHSIVWHSVLPTLSQTQN